MIGSRIRLKSVLVLEIRDRRGNRANAADVQWQMWSRDHGNRTLHTGPIIYHGRFLPVGHWVYTAAGEIGTPVQIDRPQHGNC